MIYRRYTFDILDSFYVAYKVYLVVTHYSKYITSVWIVFLFLFKYIFNFLKFQNTWPERLWLFSVTTKRCCLFFSFPSSKCQNMCFFKCGFLFYLCGEKWITWNWSLWFCQVLKVIENSNSKYFCLIPDNMERSHSWCTQIVPMYFSEGGDSCTKV